MKKQKVGLLVLPLLLMVMSFNKEQLPESFAIIELFTSQGCSSCPQADKLLSQTIANAKKDGKKIMALSFHVDYWNRLGWLDPFSEKKYSQLQRDYASALHLSNVYTPQMIVNGTTEFVGSNNNELTNALERSLHTTPAAAFKMLTATFQVGAPPLVKYELERAVPGCKLHFALVSLNETTYVKHGENGGHILKNENVVRQFISAPISVKGQIQFDVSPIPEKNNLAVVAYIQQEDLKIIGASMAVIN